MGLLDKKLAFVFPGQGAQVVGMGKDLAQNYVSAADLFKKADDVLGFSLSDLCFNGPEEELLQTINTQPALYVTSVAAYEVGKENGLQPIVSAGHSVGEYAALYASGAFSFEDGLILVRKRAEFMQKVGKDNPGSMAAILGLSLDQVKVAVDKASYAGIVVAANVNSPIQTVISGESDAVKRASEIASEMGAKRVVPLNVSGAFHSPLMQSAADLLKSALDEANINDLTVPVVANFTADVEKTSGEVRKNLADQVTGSVRWVESIERILDLKAEVFVEYGAGNVLSGLIKRIFKDAVVYSISDKASLESALNSLVP